LSIAASVHPSTSHHPPLTCGIEFIAANETGMNSWSDRKKKLEIYRRAVAAAARVELKIKGDKFKFQKIR
jgi:hypothetical protein